MLEALSLPEAITPGRLDFYFFLRNYHYIPVLLV